MTEAAHEPFVINADKIGGKVVSIITPTYNQGQFIEECIRSVRGQNHPSIEHIIIDGGSTDRTLEIIRKYSDGLAYWVSEKDTGIADAINKGWRRATGEFLWVLNSDDLLVAPDAVSALVRYLEQNPDVGFVYGDRYDIDEAGRLINAKRFPDYDLLSLLLVKGDYPFPGCLMRRRALDEIGFLNQNYPINNDLDFFIRLARRYKIGHLRQPTGCFRFHSAQKSTVHLYSQARETIAIYEETLRAPDLPLEVRRHERKIQAVAYRTAGGCCFHSGHSNEARSYLLRAIHFFPLLLFNPRVVTQLLLTFFGDRGMVWAHTAVRRLGLAGN